MCWHLTVQMCPEQETTGPADDNETAAVTVYSTSLHKKQLRQQFAIGKNCGDNLACCSGDKITVLAEDESDDEEDEGFKDQGTEEIILP